MGKKDMHFYRKNDNIGYSEGTLFFGENCENNLIISMRNKFYLENTRDSLIVVTPNQIEYYPISELEEVIKESRKLLENKKIIYHRPQSVFERENLKEKSAKFISGILKEEYKLSPVKIHPINDTGRRNAIYYIEDSQKNKYIFRNTGTNLNKIQGILKITNSSPNLFPRTFNSKEQKSYIELEDGIYTIEEFLVRDLSKKEVSYVEIGRKIAEMHNHLDAYSLFSKFIIESFKPKSGRLTESNLAALWIDFYLAGMKSLTEVIEGINNEDLEKRLDELPNRLIHGELNASNRIYTSEGLKFIDTESLRVSKKVFEIESPLIFQGNMKPPFYNPGSLKSLINGYNQNADNPLTEEEKEISKLTTQYALVKNFAIRNIRREEKENTLNLLMENLSKIKKDSI